VTFHSAATDTHQETAMPDAAFVGHDELIRRRDHAMSPSVKTFPIFPRNPMVLTRGEGQYVFDDAGKRYLDGTTQNLCISLGFGHPLTMAMAAEQLHAMQHCTTLFYHETPMLYAEELTARMPAGSGDWVVHLVNSGAEAIDLAFTMARVFTRNFEILTLRNGYHGLQMGALGSTSFAACRPPIPPPAGFVSVHHPDQYKGVFGPGIEPYLAEIERTIGAATSGAIAGMIFEPIQGFGGVVPMPPGYLARAADITRRAGGLVIMDEVQTGFGRMGSHYWGFEAHGVTPDIVVLGKGMGNGMPISGVIVRRDVAEAFAQTRFFNTFGANPVAVAAARSVIMAIRDEGLQDNAAARGAQLEAGLHALARRHDLIGDVRGSGLIMGFELVTDRISKSPATAAGERIQDALRDAGFITVRGTPGRNVFRINPPMCVTAADIDELIGALGLALAAVA
jgi:alanine-glyoxylate transaminase/(R)-3-amino-2-methylpropionate-pyruvate transaminase